MHRLTPRRLAALTLTIALAVAAAPAADDAVAPVQPGDGDRCPVCGMRVAPHAAWIAQVVFVDGSALFFDGSKDLFKYLFSRNDLAPEKRDLEIVATFVTSYYDLQLIPAGSAYFVVGSDVLGPMGPELVPHPSLTEAQEFLRDHAGRRIVPFDEVTAELVETLHGGHGRGHKPKPGHG